MAERFRRVFKWLVPSWLGGGAEPNQGDASDGYLHLYSLGVMQDAFIERAYQGIKARFPQTSGALGALAAIARDRRIPRGVGESDAVFAARLIGWRHPRGHRTRGNAFALLRQLRAYLNAAAMVRTVDVRGNWYTIEADGTEVYEWGTGTWEWDWVSPPTGWSRFWVILYTDTSAWTAANTTAVQRIIDDWKPAHATLNTLIVASDSDPDPFSPSAPEPDGTWDVPANRNGTALYFDE